MWYSNKLDKKGAVETIARQKTLAEMHTIMNRYNLDHIWRINKIHRC